MENKDFLEKRALIIGIAGQDGSYLAEFLLEKGYQVYGIHKKTSVDVLKNIGDLKRRINLMEGDITDMNFIIKAINEIQPTEVYNLAAQSFIPDSWAYAILTTNINSLGVLNVLEAIRIINPSIKFYQASTSQMFGKVQESPQNEKTPFYPVNPFGTSKVYGHHITRNYRENYNLFACSGILFNHESPRKEEKFITKKISRSVAKIKLGYQDYFEIGNMDSKRDWGYAKDYVESMWLMLQQNKPQDYVIGTGETHSVREFVEEAFNVVDMHINWEGKGLDEVGKYNGKVVVKINPAFYRPTEVDILLADPSKAKKELGWQAKNSFKEIAKMMVEFDLGQLEKNKLN